MKEFLPNEIERETLMSCLESLISHQHKINEGNHGVIGLVDLNDLDPVIVNIFLENYSLEKEGRIPDRIAIKMLKVYSDVNLAKEEGEIQSEAAKILKTSGLEGVSVPEVYFCDQVNIASDSLKNYLSDQGVEVGHDGVGVILMDYVEGQDMAEYLYKKVIEADNYFQRDFKAIFGEDSKVSFNDLHQFVFNALNFEKPGGKHEEEHLKGFEERQVGRANFKKLINFLQKHNFILKSEILNKIKQATDALHKNNLYHRDLHERNVMLEIEDDEVKNISLIDFGRAKKILPEDKKDVYSENYGESTTVSDDYIFSAYQILTKPMAEQEEELFYKKINDTLIVIKNRPERKAAYEALLDNIKNKLTNIEEDDDEEVFDDIKDMIIDFCDKQINAVDFEANWQLRLAVLDEVGKEFPDLVQPINQYLTNYLENNKRLQIYLRNLISKFLAYNN